MDFLTINWNDLFNTISNKAYDLLDWMVKLLPGSPFSGLVSGVPAGFRSTMGYVNYFVPVAFCLQVAAAWLAAIIIYYVVQLVLRWIKAIE